MSEQQTPAVEKRPRPKGQSPTARTLAELRELGFTAQTVERFCAYTKRRIDLFGIIDIVACKEGVGIVGIQATSSDNLAARRKKAMDEPRLRVWLAAGAKFELWGWSKRGAHGTRKLWDVRREEITLEAFA